MKYQKKLIKKTLNMLQKQEDDIERLKSELNSSEEQVLSLKSELKAYEDWKKLVDQLNIGNKAYEAFK